MIKAEIIADSINNSNDRITTFVLTYPRIIHSEVMTHRAFSRNAASSRAVPTEKLINSIIDTPFIPIKFQKKHKGMQGDDYFNYDDSNEIKKIWIESRDYAILQAKKMHEFGVTKQLINRIIEPYQYYTTIVTATEFENFFRLRCPQYVVSGYPSSRSPEALEPSMATFRSKRDAIEWLPDLALMTEMDWFKCNEGMGEIHIMALAECMWDAYKENQPTKLEEGGWHIPFGDNFDEDKLKKLMPEIQPASLGWYMDYIDDLKVKIATARCARVSYTVVGEEGKETDYSTDIKLHDRLAESGHASPFEHCAKACSGAKSRNFKGFLQYRELCEL